MNGVLRHTATTASLGTFRRWAAGLALGSTIVAIAVAVVAGPPWAWLEVIVVPLLAAWLVWAVAGVSRLRLVGFLPHDAKDDDLIPAALRPWIRFWLMFRLGLLWAMMFLFVATIAAAITRREVNIVAVALVYVVAVRFLIDGAFGAAFNIGIIRCRQS